MTGRQGPHAKRVNDLTNGDKTLDYGVVAYREGRKVWFDKTIVTFPSLDDRVAVSPDTVVNDNF